jgi:hypothetical protein
MQITKAIDIDGRAVKILLELFTAAALQFKQWGVPKFKCYNNPSLNQAVIFFNTQLGGKTSQGFRSLAGGQEEFASIPNLC